LEVSRRVLGNAHPNTLSFAQSLELVRSRMHAEQPTTGRGKASVRRSKRAAAPALSPTALAEAEEKASAAEAELLAMLDLEDSQTGGGSGSAKGKARAKAKGESSKR
jgi:hypothetical protein